LHKATGRQAHAASNEAARPGLLGHITRLARRPARPGTAPRRPCAAVSSAPRTAARNGSRRRREWPAS